MRRDGRHERRLAGMKGKHWRRARKMLRWYLGLHERWSIEGELGRQPVLSAIRESYLEQGRKL